MTSYPKMIKSLENARDRATNSDFKLLWESKIIQLKRKRDLLLMGVNGTEQGDLLNGWPEDGPAGENL
jgi:hypothetical protein